MKRAAPLSNAPIYNNQMILPQPVQVQGQPIIRKCRFDPTVKTLNLTMIMGQIIAGITTQGITDVEIDVTSLAAALGSLNARFSKITGEMIAEYKLANKEEITVMGKKDATPYSGYYDKAKNSTTFDVQKLPDSLVIILMKFVELVRDHTK